MPDRQKYRNMRFGLREIVIAAEKAATERESSDGTKSTESDEEAILVTVRLDPSVENAGKTVSDWFNARSIHHLTHEALVYGAVQPSLLGPLSLMDAVQSIDIPLPLVEPGPPPGTGPDYGPYFDDGSQTESQP